MRVSLLLNKKEMVKEGNTIEEIIEECGYTIESVIVLKEGKVILEEDVSDGDFIEVVPVASGG